MLFHGEDKIKTNFEGWYKISSKRYSTRVYEDKPISSADKSAIDAFCEQLNGFECGVRFEPVFNSETDMFSSFLFTRLKNVPAFIAVVGKTRKSSFEKAGFYGEALCLELTRLGLKTCWVSGSIKQKNLGDYITKKPGERFITSIAFGYGEDLSDEAIEKKHESKPRKKIDRIIIPLPANKKWKAIARCVRYAPSAVNRQPWRFSLENDRLLAAKPMIKGGPYPAELDIGIAMLHVSIAAKAVGIDGRWHRQKGCLGVFA